MICRRPFAFVKAVRLVSHHISYAAYLANAYLRGSAIFIYKLPCVLKGARGVRPRDYARAVLHRLYRNVAPSIVK